MHNWGSLSHVRWDCKYQVVFIPKYRKRVMYGKLRKQVGEMLRNLWRRRGVELIEGHAMPDHTHVCLASPPKFSVSAVIGFLKGKSGVRIHRSLLEERRLAGLHFWSPGYCVSTVGLDERVIREYTRRQEAPETGQAKLDFE